MFAAMNWGDFANYATATAPVVGLVLWLGRVLWKNIRHELTPNSGTSLRDAVDRIEDAVGCLQGDINRLDKAIERHLGFHEGTSEQLPHATKHK